MPRASAASSTARAVSTGPSPRSSIGSSSSAWTVVETTCVSASWATKPTVPASSAGPTSRVERPTTRISPAISPPWKCGTSPHAARSSVLLPEPERPARTTNSPGAISRSMPESASASEPG